MLENEQWAGSPEAKAAAAVYNANVRVYDPLTGHASDIRPTAPRSIIIQHINGNHYQCLLLHTTASPSRQTSRVPPMTQAKRSNTTPQIWCFEGQIPQTLKDKSPKLQTSTHTTRSIKDYR
jgi:hypothetical protein